MSYYSDKISVLERMFGQDVTVADDAITIGTRTFPVLDDVIILLDEEFMPPNVRARVGAAAAQRRNDDQFSEETQFTFGVQWQKFSELLPEHKIEFHEYFDLVDLASLKGKLALDLGCGIGRWSYFLAPHCGHIALMDFSEAIFVARRNLRNHPQALFFMGDINKILFKPDCADFVFSLGVLHHMPQDALGTIRRLKDLAPLGLYYLYYDLDNRGIHFRIIFEMMNALRKVIGGMRNEPLRDAFVTLITATVYMPFILLARVMRLVKLEHVVPLHAYIGKSFQRVRQDAYDKLLTRIEQRVSRKQINTLSDTYSSVVTSPNLPYWHFLVRR